MALATIKDYLIHSKNCNDKVINCLEFFSERLRDDRKKLLKQGLLDKWLNPVY